MKIVRKIIKRIHRFFTKTLIRKIFSGIMSVLLIVLSIQYVFVPSQKAYAASVHLSMDEGYGTSSAVNDANSTISAGSITNAIWRTEEFCKQGKCLYFDGSGDYVSFSDNQALDIGAGDDVTIVGWFRTPDISSGSRVIVAKYETTGSDGGYKVYMNSSGQLIFGIDNDNSSFPSDSATSTNSYDDNKWHSFSAVKAGTSSITLYVDGVLAGTDSSITSSKLSNNDTFYVGIDGDGSSNGFSGFLDEIQIIRTARSATEISNDYLGHSTFANGAGPVGYWKLDEAGGSTRYDSSGNGNNLTETSGTIAQATGKIDYAADFERGDTEYLTITDANQTGLDLGNKFTLEAWLNVESTSGNYEGIMGRGEGAGWSYMWATAGNEDFKFMLDGDGFAGGGIEITSNADIFVTGEWNHFAITYDGVSLRLFKNGIEQNSGDFPYSTTITPYNSSGSFRLGNWSSQGEYYDGLMDEVKIYNYVRTTEQIVRDMYEDPPSGISASFGPESSYLSNGLIGYWPMDEISANSCTGGSNDSCDKSGNNIDLAWTNGTNTGGKYGYGTIYDGTDDYASCTDANCGGTQKLDFGAGTSFSWGGWFKTADTTGQMGGKRNNLAIDSPGYAMVLGNINVSDGEPSCWVSDGTTHIVAASGVQKNDNEWHHSFCVVKNGTVQIFVDGVLMDYEETDINGNRFTGSFDNSVDFKIGEHPSGALDYSGQIDEYRVYNRSLSPGEVKKLYEWAPGPVGYWKVDEPSGATAYDSSGNSNSGTVTSAQRDIGKYGGGLSSTEDGTQEYTSISDPSSGILDFDDTQEFTISAMVKINSIEGISAIISKGDYFATGNYALYVIDAGGGGNTSCEYSAGSGDDDYIESLGTFIHDDNWHHVACVMDRDGSEFGAPGLYHLVDGIVYAADTSLTAGSAVNSEAFEFGESATTEEFEGKIDNVKVYNYARTIPQIIEDLNAGHPQSGSPVGSSIGYWKLDEGYGTTANDTGSGPEIFGTGAGFNLTLSSVSWTTNGKFGKAWNGDGTKWLSISDGATADYMDPGTDEKFTYSFWFKSDSATNPVTNDQYIIHKKSSGNAPGYRIGFTNSTGTLFCQIDDDSTSFPEDSATTSTDYYDGNWHFGVCTRNISNDTLDLYVDGTLVAQDTDLSATGSLGNSATLYFGDDDGDSTNSFAGDLDEMKFYNNTVSQETVLALFNNSSSALMGATSTDSSGNPTWSALNEYCPPGQGSSCTGPYAEYKLDENTGTTAYDTGTSGQNGTLYNTAKYTAGKYGSAVYFDGDTTGNDTHIQLPNGAFNSLTEGTISLWYNSNLDSSSADWQDFFTVRDNSAGNYLELAYQISDNTVRWWGDGCGTALDASFTVPNPSGWHHIAVTVDSNGYKMYLDGMQMTSGSNTCFFDDLVGASTEHYAIGCYDAGVAPACSGEHYRGYIDHLRIYNYARTGSQIAWEFNQGGPVGWWKMDESSWTNNCSTETVYDSSGFNNNGTSCPSSTGPTGGVSGKSNNAGLFDATNDYINVGDPSELRLTSTGSVSMWINPSNIPSTGWDIILSKGNWGAGRNNYSVYYVGGSPANLRFDLGGSAGLNYILLSETLAPANTWTHLAYTWNGSTIYAYINGEQVSSASQTQTPDTTGYNLNFGTSSGSSSYVFDGKIDDIKIFNYALTKEQVRTQMNSGAAINFTQ